MITGGARTGSAMQVNIEDTGSRAKIVLNGKLDIAGADAIALPLATLSGDKNAVIVDMTDVSFIASIAIRHLVGAAKTISRRGGRLVLLNPNEMVTDVLVTCGVSQLMPIVRSEEAALSAIENKA
jgi:anti-anti-sigma factor